MEIKIEALKVKIQDYMNQIKKLQVDKSWFLEKNINLG